MKYLSRLLIALALLLPATASAQQPAGVVIPAVVADGQFLSDGIAISGSPVLQSATNHFAVADIGKLMQCTQNGSWGQPVFSSHVDSYQGPTQVTLSSNLPFGSSNAKCQWGTENGPTINAAKASLAPKGGAVLLPTGYAMATAIDMTNCAACRLSGVVPGSGAHLDIVPGIGTVIVDTGIGNYPAVDFTSSSTPILENVQIGSEFSPVTSHVHILFGRDATSARGDRLIMRNVSTAGYCDVASFYELAGRHASIENSGFGCTAVNPRTVMLTTEPRYGIKSAYRTLPTSAVPNASAGGAMINVEIHATSHNDTKNYGVALFMIGNVSHSHNFNVGIDAQSYVGAVYLEQDSLGRYPGNHSFNGLEIYSEGSQQSDYCFNAAAVPSYPGLYVSNYLHRCVTSTVGSIPYNSTFQDVRN